MRTRLVLLAVSHLALGCPEKKQEPAFEPPKPVATPEPQKPAEAEPSQPSGPTGEGIGSIEGEVAFEGQPPEAQPVKAMGDPACKADAIKDESVIVSNGRLANAVVRLKNGPKGEAPKADVVVDQKGCIYTPRVQAAMKGQTLRVKNSDGTMHNVHTYEGTKTWFNRAQPPKAADIVLPIDKNGVVKLKCDVHPWMTGYVVLAESPHFATTGSDGKFALKDVPSGTYTVEVWHERFGTKTQEVTVKPNEAAKVTFTYRPEDKG